MPRTVRILCHCFALALPSAGREFISCIRLLQIELIDVCTVFLQGQRFIVAYLFIHQPMLLLHPSNNTLQIVDLFKEDKIRALSVKTHYLHVLTMGGMFPDNSIKILEKRKKKKQFGS